jgi:hypothetical protein
MFVNTAKWTSGGYATAMASVDELCRKEVPNFPRLSMTEQNVERAKMREKIKADYLAKTETFRRSVTDAVKDAQTSLAKIRTPLLASAASSDRSAGELQVLNGNLFFAGKPAPSAVVSAVRTALLLGRTDFATTIIDSVRASIPRTLGGQINPNDEQAKLLAELDTQERTWEDYSAQQKRAQDLASVEVFLDIAEEMREQIEAGWSALSPVDLIPLLPEEERERFLSVKAPTLTGQSLRIKALNRANIRANNSLNGG